MVYEYAGKTRTSDHVYEIGVLLGDIREGRVGQTAEQVVVAAVDLLCVDLHRPAQRGDSVTHRRQAACKRNILRMAGRPLRDSFER